MYVKTKKSEFNYFCLLYNIYSLLFFYYSVLNTQPVDVEFYFKCHGSNHGNSLPENMGGEVPPLEMIRPNIRLIPCLACGDTMDEIDLVAVFDCAEQHVCCLDCFIAFCLSRLNERQFILDANLGYTLGCPVGCDNSYIKQLKHFRLLRRHDYERYQRFAAEEAVLKAGGVLCPQPGCGMGILPDPEGAERPRRIVCETCGFVFCRFCTQGYHIGECYIDQDMDINAAHAMVARQQSSEGTFFFSFFLLSKAVTFFLLFLVA